MEFQYIVLKRAELKRLHKLSKQLSGLPSEATDKALINNHLAVRSRYGSNSPDATCPPSVITHITEEGKHYLIYAKQRKRDFLIASYGIIGSIISGVISSLIVLWLQGLL